MNSKCECEGVSFRAEIYSHISLMKFFTDHVVMLLISAVMIEELEKNLEVSA